MQAALPTPAHITLPIKELPRGVSSVPLPSEAAPTPAVPAPLILFGRDERGRPHAARFVVSQSEAVEHAADLMDLYCVAADTDALRDLSSMLPSGRTFPASGKAFVPFVKAALYDRLLAATGTRETPPLNKAASRPAEGGESTGGKQGGGADGSGAGDPPANRIGAKAPSDHSQIGLGSLVLAHGDDEDDEGYYPAKVILTKADDHFVLTWADYPDLPEFSRPRRALALLHPETAAKAG